jgi:ABC-type transport system involved in cytochrome bd biosynthesis fused ATPase/permease subunit
MGLNFLSKNEINDIAVKGDPKIFVAVFLIGASIWSWCFLISASAFSRPIIFAIFSATAFIRFFASLRNGLSSSSGFSSR